MSKSSPGDVAPSVSTVIPSYNRRMQLPRAVASCQRQTYPIREIIVVDDGSTDGTEETMRQISIGDSRIKYIRLQENKGPAYARIEGIKASTSDWIAFLDSDDELLPDSVAVRVRAACSSATPPGLVYGDYHRATDQRSVLPFPRLSGYSYPWLCRELSLCGYPAIMVRKDCFDITGYPDPHLRSWEDDDMVLTVGKHFPILHCGAPVAIIHSEFEGITADWSQLARGCRLIVSKYRNDIVKHHGYSRLILWYIRVIRAHLLSMHQKHLRRHQAIIQETQGRYTARRIASAAYCRTLRLGIRLLTRYLRPYFHFMYS